MHEFERVQRASRRVREANGDVAEVELMVERIKQELSYRDQERDPTAIFLRRLTSSIGLLGLAARAALAVEARARDVEVV